MKKDVKKEIMEHLENNDGAFFGGIAMKLRYPNITILKNLLELKSNGLIYKDQDGGRYKIKELSK